MTGAAPLPCVDEPGKQVKSATKIKNTSKSHVAFKVCIYAILHCTVLFQQRIC
jgi:hypothetical protein